MRLLISIGICLFGIVLPTIIGFVWTAYSPVSNYLSELGATGAPYAGLMNFAGFLPVGILWALGVLVLLGAARTKLLWLGVLLLLGTSVSYIGAAFYPCDAGCPLEGSDSQMMHNVLGIVGYLTSPVGLVLVGLHYLGRHRKVAGTLSLAAAVSTALGFAMMVNPDMETTRGAWQRLADFSLFIWLLSVSISLRKEH